MTTHKEALTALVHEMEYVLSCINADKIPFDGDDFHEALRLGKEALEQQSNEQVEPVACCEKYFTLEYCPECGKHIGADMRKKHIDASDEAVNLAKTVWDALNRFACPEPFMRLAYETVIKNTHPPVPTAQPNKDKVK